MNTRHRSLADILSEQYLQKKTAKPSYSLRSYARFLGISPSTLHVLMSGNKTASKKTLTTIAKRAGLLKSEISYFSDLFEAKSAKTDDKKKTALRKARLHDSRQSLITDEEFQLIASWRHFALMELIKTQGFRNDADWIASRLRMPEKAVSHALEALEKLKVLRLNKDGTIDVLKDFVALPSGNPTLVAQNYHQTMVEEALDAIKNQPKGTRNFSSLVLKFRTLDISRVDEFIRKFRREFSIDFEEGEGHDAVYALAVQFFRLDSP